jgi:hypothetical protein
MSFPSLLAEFTNAAGNDDIGIGQGKVESFVPVCAARTMATCLVFPDPYMFITYQLEHPM